MEMRKRENIFLIPLYVFAETLTRPLSRHMGKDELRRKALSVTMVTLLLTAMSTLAFNIQTVKSEPTTIMVPDQYAAIQEAIDAASPGDTVYVKAGTYYEHVIVNKNDLTLVGEDRSNTVIDGNRTGTVIKITASNVVISGFTIQNGGSEPGPSYAGVWISGPANLTGNYITRNSIGVYVNSFECNIIENNLTNNGHGISLHSSYEVRVEANDFSANTFGISIVAQSFNNIIRNNNVTRSHTGGHGIYLSNSFNNTIFSNDLTNNYHGIWLVGSSNNRIVENNIANNKLLGVELSSSSDNFFYHNNFINNPTPVRLDGKSISVWDDGYPSGGNYWSDYIDVDEKSGPNQDQPNSDGIWDNPYVMDKSNQDRYPFVKPYGEIPDFLVDKTKPTANAGSDRTVNVGTPVTFDASGSTDNVGIVSYEWDFGDGTTESGMTLTHTYSEPGSYMVTLTVKDAAGNSDSDSIIVTVVETPSNGEDQVSPKDSPLWSDWVVAAIIGIAIALMIFGRGRKYRRYRRGKRK
jgi:parallel beta-helix repeat protein